LQIGLERDELELLLRQAFAQLLELAPELTYAPYVIEEHSRRDEDQRDVDVCEGGDHGARLAVSITRA
jgi:hypothetical protein